MDSVLLVIVVLTLLPLALMWWRNLPLPKRFAQLWSPLTATAASVVFIMSFVAIDRMATGVFQGVVSPYLPGNIAGQSGIVQAVSWVSMNLLLLWGFAVVKLLGNLIQAMRLRKERDGEIWIPGGERSAFYRGDSDIVYVRREMVFPGVILRILGGISLLLTLASPMIWLLVGIPSLPLLPAVATLLLLEWGWYLQGLRPEGEGEGMLSGSMAIGTVEANYRNLWEDYQKIWPEWILACAELKGQSRRGLTDDVGASLAKNNTAILKGWTPSLFATQFFQMISERLLEHGKVLLVVGREEERTALVELLRRRLMGRENIPQIWKISEYRQAGDEAEGADILVALIECLANPLEIIPEALEKWLSDVSLVVVPDVGGLFENLSHFAAFCHQQVDLGENVPDFVIMSTDRFSLEPHLRSSLPLSKSNREFDLGVLRPESAHVIAWKLEQQPWFQQRLFPASTDRRYLGAETVLSLPAWGDGIAHITLTSAKALPWDEYLEEIDIHRAQLHNAWVSTDSLGDMTAHARIEVPSSVWMENIRRNGCRLVRDNANNISVALAGNWGRAHGSLLLHLVSPAYLLRDYLVDNLDYFSIAPLLPLTPQLSNVKLAVAMALLERMSSRALSEERLLHLLRRVDQETAHVETGIADLYRELFGLDLWAMNAIHYEVRLVVGDNGVVKQTRYFKLDPTLRQQPAFSWMVPMRLEDTNGAHLRTITMDHLYQTVLPGQFMVFYGKPFAWVKADIASRTIVFSHKTPEGELCYRPHLEICFADGCFPQQGKSGERISVKGWNIRENLCESEFAVIPFGYQKFEASLHLDNAAERYREVKSTVPARRYPQGRIFCLEFETTGKSGYDWDRLRFTLAHLINEMLPTLFPETYQYLHVSTPLPAGFFKNPCLEKIHRKVNLPLNGNHLDLYFIEDSRADMGLAAAVQRHWDKYIFELLYDYLSWLKEGKAQFQGAWQTPKTIEPETYLFYGLDGIPGELDLDGAHRFLAALGCGGTNSLSALRREFYEKKSAGGVAARERHQCDFCQADITETELERLQDGRERCADCRETAVNSPEELKTIYLEARRFLVENLRAAISRDIVVAFVSAEELHALRGEQFLPTSSFDTRAIGLACWQNGKCAILIENGQPRAMTLATMVHELTHVWQFDTLDFTRMEKESGKLLIEGLAMWTELTCLRSKKMAPGYCDKESRRSDIYGQGYREVSRLHESTGRNPFHLLLERFRKDGT